MEKINEEDYYIKEGRVVFTKKYLLKRKKCCGNKCEHCPFIPLYEKGSTTII
jgi:hypothetical protein